MKERSVMKERERVCCCYEMRSVGERGKCLKGKEYLSKLTYENEKKRSVFKK